mgnify:CR=1 FL=1
MSATRRKRTGRKSKRARGRPCLARVGLPALVDFFFPAAIFYFSFRPTTADGHEEEEVVRPTTNSKAFPWAFGRQYRVGRPVAVFFEEEQGEGLAIRCRPYPIG